jgi:hypothetical protein
LKIISKKECSGTLFLRLRERETNKRYGKAAMESAWESGTGKQRVKSTRESSMREQHEKSTKKQHGKSA